MKRTNIDGHAWPPENYPFEFLKDPNGSVGMNVDGSNAPVEFEYRVETGMGLSLHVINVVLIHTTVAPTDFGALGELTNGLLVDIRDPLGAVKKDMCGGQPVVRNADWRPLAGVESQERIGAASDDSMTISFDFDDNCGAPMRLKAGDSVRFTVRDNLSTITLFRAMVQGLLYNSG